MELEFVALEHNKTQYLVLSLSSGKVIDCKWVYKLKLQPNGQIERDKARLVAKSYHQTEGIDYFETFNLVVKPPTIRIILSLALSQNWCIRQLDIHKVFLHGDLAKVIFMEQPLGFVDPLYPTHVCKLDKSLYDLKQSPRVWYTKLSTSLLHLGFLLLRMTLPYLFVIFLMGYFLFLSMWMI